MVFTLQYHAWFAVVALAVHLAAGNQALLGGKSVIFKEKITAPASLDQEWIGVETITRRPHDSETVIGDHFRDVSLRLHDNRPLLTEQTFHKFIAKGSHDPLCQKTRHAYVAQSARNCLSARISFGAQLHTCPPALCIGELRHQNVCYFPVSGVLIQCQRKQIGGSGRALHDPRPTLLLLNYLGPIQSDAITFIHVPKLTRDCGGSAQTFLLYRP